MSKITVHLVDPEEQVLTEIDARDRRAFERTGRRDLSLPPKESLQELVQANPETYLTWLAWHSLVRTGATMSTFLEFEGRVVLTESTEMEDTPFGDPTAMTS